MSKPLTDEQFRILLAVDDGRLFLNKHGRWEIECEERPDRRARERLRGRGLILPVHDNGPTYRITAKGRNAIRTELDRRRAERAAL